MMNACGAHISWLYDSSDLSSHSSIRHEVLLMIRATIRY